jgi:hypothetical protein
VTVIPGGIVQTLLTMTLLKESTTDDSIVTGMALGPPMLTTSTPRIGVDRGSEHAAGQRITHKTNHEIRRIVPTDSALSA